MGARFLAANGLRFAYLQWGDAGAPLALMCHGFPDHAHTWRHLGPALAEDGYRAVAIWMRGYAPSAISPRGRYGPDVLAADLNAVHNALRADERAVLIGHDWGAIAAYRAASAAPGRWRRVVTMAVPPEPALAGAGVDPGQWRRSWYTAFFQLPGAERLAARNDLALIDRLWADWSPGYERDEVDRGPLKATLRSPGALGAAIGYYRAVGREVLRRRFPSSTAVPSQPTLYLHGADDGCMKVALAAGAADHLPHPDSRVEVVDGTGHFLHLEAPEVVNGHVRTFLAS